MSIVKGIDVIQISNCIDAIKDCEKLLCIASYKETRNILLTVKTAYYNMLRSCYIDAGLSPKQAGIITAHIRFMFDEVKPYHKNGGVFSIKDAYNQRMALHIYNQGKDDFQ